LAASDLRFAPSPALGKEVRPVPDRPRHKTGFYSMLGRAGQTLERREATDRSATFPKWNLMLCAHAAHGVETERRLAWGVGCRTARQAQDLFMFNSSSLRSEFISICRKRWQAQASGSEETGRLGCGRRTRLCPKPSPFVPKWCAARTLTSGESTEASVRGRKQRLPDASVPQKQIGQRGTGSRCINAAVIAQEPLSDLAMLWYDQDATDQGASFTKPPQYSSVAQWQSIRLLTGGL
jgi:hypothetical protein